MPIFRDLSPKGEKIFASMKKTYGPKKAMEIFSAMEGEGKIQGGRLEVTSKVKPKKSAANKAKSKGKR